jgi:hypothetical protein
MGLYEMARGAYDHIQGVDWDALQAQTGLGIDDVVYDIAFIDYMKELSQRLLVIRQTVELSWDIMTPEAAIAFDMAERDVLSVEGSFARAVSLNVQDMDEELMIDRELFRATITKLYKDALEGVYTHTNYVLQMAGFTPTEIARSADQVSVAIESLELLLSWGVLNPILRKPQSLNPEVGREVQQTSGLGFVLTTGVAWAISIGAVLVVAVIAAAMVSNKEMTRLGDQRKIICDIALNDPHAPNREAILKACVDLQREAQNNMKPPTGTEGLNKAIQIVAIGLVAYGAVLMMPHFTKALGQAKLRKGAAREARKAQREARL